MEIALVVFRNFRLPKFDILFDSHFSLISEEVSAFNFVWVSKLLVHVDQLLNLFWGSNNSLSWLFTFVPWS